MNCYASLGCTWAGRAGRFQIEQLQLFEKELEQEILSFEKTMPAKQRMYRSLGILGGLFFSDFSVFSERRRTMEVSIIFQNRSSGHPGLRADTGIKTQRKGGTGFFNKSCRINTGSYVDNSLYI